VAIVLEEGMALCEEAVLQVCGKAQNCQIFSALASRFKAKR
jgi:hypothetical protein